MTTFKEHHEGTQGDDNGKPDDETYDWLINGTDLLTMGDPGAVPFLIDQLLVDRALGAIQGSYKAGKTWIILELCISVVTGRPAFGVYNVENPGPVILILEESSQLDTRRRLSQLSRGYNISPVELQHLHTSSNVGVKLGKRRKDWRKRIEGEIERIKPRLVIFDPLVRIKGIELSENLQGEIGEVTDYLTQLNRQFGTCVCFSHHTGHLEQGRMRGTSDLEAWWSSKLSIKRKEQTYTLLAEHREAPDPDPLEFALIWNDDSKSIRLRGRTSNAPTHREIILGWFRENPDRISTDSLSKAVHIRKADVTAEVKRMEYNDLLNNNGDGWALNASDG